MCVLFIHSRARIFIIFCWMAGKHKSPERNWLPSTFTLNRRLSTLVRNGHDCNWLQWNAKVWWYSTPPSPRTLTSPPNAKCKFTSESWYVVWNHPLFSSPVEKASVVELVTLETAWLRRILRNTFQASEEKLKQTRLNFYSDLVWHLWLSVNVNGCIINANRMLP